MTRIVTVTRLQYRPKFTGMMIMIKIMMMMMRVMMMMMRVMIVIYLVAPLVFLVAVNPGVVLPVHLPLQLPSQHFLQSFCK